MADYGGEGSGTSGDGADELQDDDVEYTDNGVYSSYELQTGDGEETDDASYFPHEIQLQILMDIPDRDAYYEALLVQGFVAMRPTEVAEGAVRGRELHWSESPGPVGGVYHLKKGQIFPEFADKYLTLMLRDIKKLERRNRKTYTFTSFGRDIWVRMRGDATLAALLADPDVRARIKEHVWYMDIKPFTSAFYPMIHDYSDMWLSIVRIAFRKVLRQTGFSDYTQRELALTAFRNQEVGRVVLFPSTIVPRLIWFYNLRGARKVDITSVLSHFSMYIQWYIGRANSETSNSALLAMARAWDDDQRITLRTKIPSAWYYMPYILLMIDVMIAHNKYTIENKIQGRLFSVTAVCELASMVLMRPTRFGDNVAQLTRYRKAPYVPWKHVYKLFLENKTGMSRFDAMSTYFRIPSTGEVECTLTGVSGKRIMSLFGNHASYAIFCIPILLAAVKNTPALLSHDKMRKFAVENIKDCVRQSYADMDVRYTTITKDSAAENAYDTRKLLSQASKINARVQDIQ